MGLKSMVGQLLVRKLAPQILRRVFSGLLGRNAYRGYGYAAYAKPKSRGLLGKLKKLLKKLS